MDEKFLEAHQERLEKENDQRINSIRSMVPTGPSSKTQCFCGNSIHPARAKIGYETCIGCAEVAHQKNSQYRGYAGR